MYQYKLKEKKIIMSYISRKNDFESFYDWFDDEVKSFDDIEKDGGDFYDYVENWCNNNNHKVCDDGIYNNNIKYDNGYTDDIEMVMKYLEYEFNGSDMKEIRRYAEDYCYDNSVRIYFEDNDVERGDEDLMDYVQLRIIREFDFVDNSGSICRCNSQEEKDEAISHISCMMDC